MIYIFKDNDEKRFNYTKGRGLSKNFNLTGKRTVKGSIIGGIQETQEMMDLCGKYNITSDIEVIKPDNINHAMERLTNNDVRYRFVIDIAQQKAKY